MKCPICSHDNSSDAQFCGVCRSPLTVSTASGSGIGTAELHMVSFSDAIGRGFSNYFTFSGRATRAEYWWWTLFIVVPPIFLGVLDSLLLTTLDVFNLWVVKHPIPIVTEIVFSPSRSLFVYSTVIPTIAMTSRRLHDVGISGWWQAAWVLIRVFSVGILEVLYLGSVFSAVALITSPVLPGTILDIVRGVAAFLAVDFLRDLISSFLPTWIVGVVLSVWVIVWTVRRSDDGPNKYGPDPRPALSQQP